ncbi:universal stress protein [Halostagnicola kamekurae]|uniref:Nucleotide-binding universal stress protein, UspA family n=1 Tax=Halostagnicola kamekurae TaxID=619731 RepID=A0A1I6THX5_9EURY|nr:universal stress protein [Halostagnicola kamekurae]SFS88799.1 Nucleotide-binding universal stress protein, UspA family [Halostagnicola kamekurae]
MYDHILVPVDESDPSSVALDHALEIAADRNATVSLLYVADTNEPSQTRLGTEVVDVLEETGEEVLADARDRADAYDVTVRSKLVQGNPRDVIVRYGSSIGADLVVMGTHGRGGLERYVLGSVAAHVANTAPMPVLTICGTDDSRATYPYETVLVPTDGSDHATTALKHAAAVATQTDATLSLLTVLEESMLGVGDDDERRAKAEELLDEAASTARSEGVEDVVTAVESGSVAREISGYADTEGADLIVMGTHGRQGVDQHLLGSITERVLRTASVPVLTLN